jgi:hypothetical protein
METSATPYADLAIVIWRRLQKDKENEDQEKNNPHSQTVIRLQSTKPSKPVIDND